MTFPPWGGMDINITLSAEFIHYLIIVKERNIQLFFVKMGFPYLSLQFITSKKRGHTGQQNRNGDKRHKHTLKLHSDREKCKEKSKIPTVTWLFP